MQIYQDPKFNLTVYDQSAILTDLRGGDIRRYEVDPESLVNLLDFGEIVLRQDKNLLAVARKGKQSIHIYREKAQTWDILYRDLAHEPITAFKQSLPAFLMMVQMENDEITDIYALAYNGKKPTPDTRFYRLPLPNFHPGGRLCIGSVRAGGGENPRQAALRVIFEAEFNRHLNLVGRKGTTFQVFAQTYQGKAPLRALKPDTMGEKFRKLLFG